ncbi:phage DNA packaging protein J [Pseudarthrobacter sp. WHRI 8279]|uniref:phage DNA packaging protein J n=1 Tax=Pseudarthrobacter sp. WHRI 8279 TaxID=3162566 RepID=UPI0032F078DC
MSSTRPARPQSLRGWRGKASGARPPAANRCPCAPGPWTRRRSSSGCPGGPCIPPVMCRGSLNCPRSGSWTFPSAGRRTGSPLHAIKTC